MASIMNQRRILGLPVCFGICLDCKMAGEFSDYQEHYLFSPHFIGKGYFTVKFFLAKNIPFHNQSKVLVEPNFPNRMNENCG